MKFNGSSRSTRNLVDSVKAMIHFVQQLGFSVPRSYYPSPPRAPGSKSSTPPTCFSVRESSSWDLRELNDCDQTHFSKRLDPEKKRKLKMGELSSKKENLGNEICTN